MDKTRSSYVFGGTYELSMISSSLSTDDYFYVSVLSVTSHEASITGA